MMKYIKALFAFAFSGIIIGLFISLGFSLIYRINYLPSDPGFVNRFANSSVALLVSMLIWAMIGILFGLSSLIFKIDHWSLLKQTITHAVVTYICFSILAILAGWFPFNLIMFIYFTIIFIIIYIFIWIAERLKYHALINDINRKLK
ncbi:DUF3021 domain-containing protein [Philodulcilactobacillus myokoensis]|uniref:DUF3021 domain-containing protein n=1 Tax=Philodulcilactobacillus myokoensis TaxID=2929573 RepID=A0A9W6AZW4_9LACO|nr:DUF3021 domain-containing protein [Philodulcilactobacillus myokoensis]GLB46302.1 DUF3021 domain-containing protein [Philodulcilactobacillus myokoensis]